MKNWLKTLSICSFILPAYCPELDELIVQQSKVKYCVITLENLKKSILESKFYDDKKTEVLTNMHENTQNQILQFYHLAKNLNQFFQHPAINLDSQRDYYPFALPQSSEKSENMDLKTIMEKFEKDEKNTSKNQTNFQLKMTKEPFFESLSTKIAQYSQKIDQLPLESLEIMNSAEKITTFLLALNFAYHSPFSYEIVNLITDTINIYDNFSTFSQHASQTFFVDLINYFKNFIENLQSQSILRTNSGPFFEFKNTMNAITWHRDGIENMHFHVPKESYKLQYSLLMDDLRLRLEIEQKNLTDLQKIQDLLFMKETSSLFSFCLTLFKENEEKHQSNAITCLTKFYNGWNAFMTWYGDQLTAISIFQSLFIIVYVIILEIRIHKS